MAYRNIPMFLQRETTLPEIVRETIYSAGARKETKQRGRQSDGGILKKRMTKERSTTSRNGEVSLADGSWRAKRETEWDRLQNKGYCITS